MQLQSIQVLNFKSVLDSGSFSVEGLTCLVGKNESGKTALLEALERVNPLDRAKKFQDTDWPRNKFMEWDETGKTSDVVRTTWVLDESDQAAIDGIAGIENYSPKSLTLRATYENKNVWDLSFDYAPVLKKLISESGLNEEEKAELASLTTTSKLLLHLKNLEDPSPRQEAFLKELDVRFPKGGLDATVRAYLDRNLPKFLYYSQYDTLPGQVAIDQLLQDIENEDLERDPGNKIFQALLSMVGTSPDEIQRITTSERLIANLEGVQNSLSARIFKYWSQNRHLRIRFRFDEASPGDPPPFNEGKVFRTRIENVRHGATIGLEHRSTGFIWFFSFLVWFSEVRKSFGDNLIILLDEPGLGLHAKAQSDLLRYVKEELSNIEAQTHYQVIYTTHSPFMIDPSDLLSCRTVEDVVVEDENGNTVELLGTKVGDNVLSTDAATLFPLQGALGYDITQTMFIGANSLLVEGPSDLLYLRWASNRLVERGRIGLDPRWTVTPCGGITKLSSFMALFGGSELNVAIFTDFAHGSKRKVEDLRSSELLRQGQVFSADQYVPGSEADVEDLLERKFYLTLVNEAYDLKSKDRLKIGTGKPSGRVVIEVENHFRTLPPGIPEFDHYSPSRFLHENWQDVQGKFKDIESALEPFERLFKDLNALL